MKGKNRREYEKIIECLLSNDEEVNILGLALLKKKALYQNLSKSYKYDGYDKKGYRVGYYMRDTLTVMRGNSRGFTPSDYCIKSEVETCINETWLIRCIRDWILSWLLLSLRNKYNINWKL